MNAPATMIDGATKERPILFSGPMIRAILDGRKTQTRRIEALHHLRAIVRGLREKARRRAEAERG